MSLTPNVQLYNETTDVNGRFTVAPSSIAVSDLSRIEDAWIANLYEDNYFQSATAGIEFRWEMTNASTSAFLSPFGLSNTADDFNGHVTGNKNGIWFFAGTLSDGTKVVQLFQSGPSTNEQLVTSASSTGVTYHGTLTRSSALNQWTMEIFDSEARSTKAFSDIVLTGVTTSAFKYHYAACSGNAALNSSFVGFSAGWKFNDKIDPTDAGSGFFNNEIW